jgi:DNA-binding PadR family transcriptional regulator
LLFQLQNNFKMRLTEKWFWVNISVSDISIKMVKAKIDPDNLLPLTPAVFHVLLALVGGERHGYAIMQEVTESTEGQIKMGPGTLYGTIKRLLEAQLIEESNERPDPHLDDDRRRYYRLSGVGEQVVKAEARRYADIVTIARGKKLIGKSAMITVPGGC